MRLHVWRGNSAVLRPLETTPDTHTPLCTATFHFSKGEMVRINDARSQAAYLLAYTRGMGECRST